MESKIRILVVDDDQDVHELLAVILAGAGIEPIFASDGAAAMELLATNPDIVLVLLDWMMPRMDGMAVLRELQNQPDPPPVMMLTARSDFQEVEEVLANGAVGYIVKPIEKGVLLSKIDDFLKRNRETAQARASRRKPLCLRAWTHFTVINISDSGVCFESSFPIPKGGVVFLESDDVCRRLDVPLGQRYPVRVANCSGMSNRYHIGAEFIGLTPKITHKIRKVSQRAAWL